MKGAPLHGEYFFFKASQKCGQYEKKNSITPLWKIGLPAALFTKLVLLLLLTAIELSLGGSSPYISKSKTNKNKYI